VSSHFRKYKVVTVVNDINDFALRHNTRHDRKMRGKPVLLDFFGLCHFLAPKLKATGNT